MAELTHFYHLWADGDWAIPVREHFTALAAAAFPGPVYLGIVGEDAARRHAQMRVRDLWPGELTVCAEAREGYEQVTLSRLREYAVSGGSRLVMYAHTKGAYHTEAVNDLFREELTSLVVSGWESCAVKLEGIDAVGAHWLTPGTESPDGRHVVDGPPFFAGNYWMATSAYLGSLAEPATASRFEAEGWIGTGNPRVRDLAPGWPVYLRCPYGSGTLD